MGAALEDRDSRRVGGLEARTRRLIDGAGGEESNGDQGTVVHVPAFCAPELKASWTTTVPGKVAAGVAFVLAPAGSGWCEVELRAQRQSWRGVDGRCLDVYY